MGRIKNTNELSRSIKINCILSYINYKINNEVRIKEPKSIFCRVVRLMDYQNVNFNQSGGLSLLNKLI